MEFEKILEKLINLMLAKKLQMQIAYGIVTSVDKDVCTCTLKRDGETELPNVKLRSVVDDSEYKCVQFPAIDSAVLYALIEADETNAFVLSISELESIYINVKDTTILIDQDGVVINGGENLGIIKIEKLEEKLNSLVDEINAIKDAFNGHIHTTTATIGASPTVGVIAPTTSQAQAASSFDKSYFENELVQH